MDKMQTTREKYPLGMKVRVTECYDNHITGAKGEVIGYVEGDTFSAPMVTVRFTPPVREGLKNLTHDDFYDDEIESVDAPSPKTQAMIDFELRRARVVALALQIEEAMDEICELAQKDDQIDALLPRKYPQGWGSLDEVSLRVNEWRFAMADDGSE